MEPSKPAEAPPGRPALLAQTPAYLSVPGAMFQVGLLDIDNLHRRLGDIRDSEHVGVAHTSEAFARVYGASMNYRNNLGAGDFGFDAKTDYTAVQVGGSAVIRRSETSSVRVGAAAAFGHAWISPRATPDESSTTVNTQVLSAIATYLHKDGGYVDGIMSIGNLDATTRTAANNGPVASYGGTSYAVSLETGYPLNLGSSPYQFEPQAQYVWQRINYETFTDLNGQRVDLGNQSMGVMRLGARLTRPIDTAAGTRLTPYLKANYLKGFGDGGSVVVAGTGYGLGKAGQAWQVGAGISGMATKRLTLFIDAGYQGEIGGNGWRGWLFSGGLRYSFGDK